MSIQTFPLIGGTGKGMSATLAEDGSSYNGAYAEYALKVTVRVGTLAGARRSALLEFGCKGTDQDACDLKAGLIANAIVNCSKGFVTSFVKKLGKYRNDNEGTAILGGTSQYGVLTWTNGWLESDIVTPGSEVEEELTGQIYIPFVSVNDMASNLASLTSMIESGDFCRSKFADDNRNSLIIARSHRRKGVTIKDFTGSQYGVMASNDVSNGISDSVLRHSA